MHPIFARRNRILLYLLVWVVFGLLLSVVLIAGGRVPILWAVQFALPVAVALGLQSLPLWHLVQALPPDETAPLRMVLIWCAAGGGALIFWLALAYGWQRLLPDPGVDYPDSGFGMLPLLVFAGAIGILLAVLGHYLVGAFQRSLNAERRALEMQVLAREAELKSLRAQLDPHFLFNSLNSVAALIGSDPAAARHMCFLMAQFFRKSLSLARERSIPLSEEITLIETFLAIERVRFGDRLRMKLDIAEDVRQVAVPPLVLQPLVENAVHHGIAHLIEGGEVLVSARRREGLVEIVVENPCDPDRPPSAGAGVGLSNVRSRIETLAGSRATVDVDARETSFRVSILLPDLNPA